MVASVTERRRRLTPQCRTPGVRPPRRRATIADMDIQLNGEALTVAQGATVRALLEQQGLGERRVAVEVNGEIVPRSRHAGHVLAEGDRVEIVHALGGG